MNLGNRPAQNEYYVESNYEISGTARDSLKGVIDLHGHSSARNAQEHLNSGIPRKILGSRSIMSRHSLWKDNP